MYCPPSDDGPILNVRGPLRGPRQASQGLRNWSPNPTMLSLIPLLKNSQLTNSAPNPRCPVEPIHGVTLRVSPYPPQCAQSPCPIKPTIASPKGHAFLSLLSARLKTDVTTTRPKLDMKRRTDTPHDTHKWHGTSRTQRNAVTHAMRRGENLFACCLIIPLRMV